jgi:hypothetical protein
MFFRKFSIFCILILCVFIFISASYAVNNENLELNNLNQTKKLDCLNSSSIINMSSENKLNNDISNQNNLTKQYNISTYKKFVTICSGKSTPNEGFTDPSVIKMKNSLEGIQDGIFKYYVETKDHKYAFECTIGVRHVNGLKLTSMSIILDNVYYNKEGKINKATDKIKLDKVSKMNFILNQNRKGAVDCSRQVTSNGNVVSVRQWNHNCIKNYEFSFTRLDNNKIERFNFLTKDLGAKNTMDDKTLVVTQYFRSYPSLYNRQILADFKGIN